jgi:hypothetical protein
MIDRLQRLWRNSTVAVCIIAALLAILLAQTFHSAYRVDPQTHRLDGNDFTSYLLSAKALLDGEDPYKTDTPYPYIYPPFLAFVLIPLTAIPYWLAQLIWFGVGAACLLVSCAMLVQMASSEVKTTLGWHLAMPSLVLLLVLIQPIQSNQLNGQVNSVVLLCCVMFLSFFIRNRDVPAAAYLAAAIAIKLLPAVLLVFVCVRRRYRLLAWTIAFAAFYGLLPGIVAGQSLFTFYESYAQSFLVPTMMDQAKNSETMFSSFYGVIGYCFPAAKSSLWAKIVGMAAALASMIAVDATSRNSPQLRRDVWSFCACLLGYLFMSPMAQLHHLIYAVPAVFLIGVKMMFDRAWTTGPIIALGAAFFLLFDIAAKLDKTSPAYFVSLVVLLILLVLAGRESRLGCS